MRRLCPLYLLCLALCCASCKSRAGWEAALPAPELACVSRVIIPANGGQTIRAPRFMEDAVTLWSPLDAQETIRADRHFIADATLADNGLASWLPVAERNTVRRYLYRLADERKELTGRALARAENYMPVVMAGVRKQGLPQELACLPLVESAFEPGAISSAGAAGIWQLMPDTARKYGLKVTDSVDERFDVQKSTAAATAYLAYLYRLFGDWPLAVAAYNCGEGTMQKAMAQSNCSTLDGLAAYCRRVGQNARPLKDETLRFVPQLAAAITIMTRTQSLGLAPTPAPPARRGAKATAGVKEDAERLVLGGRYDHSEQPDRRIPLSVRIQ